MTDTAPKRFTRSFTQQEPLDEEAIAAAIAVMRTGRLHRYNTAVGEESEASLLEREFAATTGASFCLAVASGGTAMQIALSAAGIGPGDRVLTNGFTLSPVPGAIAAIGAETVLVETDETLTIDLADLEAKARQGSCLLLSHMRGHLADMEAVTEICARHGLTLIEDCAHTMGASWAGKASGRWGLAGCFSTQTYKHANTGEGGLVISDDADFMARAIIRSGSYMLYDRHGAAPPVESFAAARLDMPNGSARMDNLRATILRPQLRRLPEQARRWQERYAVLETALRQSPHCVLRQIPAAESHVGSSIQFRVPGFSPAQIADLVEGCAMRGVELKWFGAAEPKGYTSAHRSWRYVPPQELPKTDRVLTSLLDMRIPLTFDLDDCALIAEIIREELERVA